MRALMAVLFTMAALVGCGGGGEPLEDTLARCVPPPPNAFREPPNAQYSCVEVPAQDLPR